MIEHFCGEDESFIELYLRVDGSFPAHHANGVFAVDGLPLGEEEGGEAQVHLSFLQEPLKRTEVNCYVLLAQLQHLIGKYMIKITVFSDSAQIKFHQISCTDG